MQGQKILDVGCGWGRYANRFLQANLEYTGVDYSPQFIELARAAHPGLDFQEMDFQKLAFPDATFDGIWGCCIFGGEPKVRAPDAIAEMLRVLKPGKLLFLILPNIGISEEMISEDWRFGLMYHAFWHSTEFAEMVTKNPDVAEIQVIHRVVHGSATFLITKE